MQALILMLFAIGSFSPAASAFHFLSAASCKPLQMRLCHDGTGSKLGKLESATTATSAFSNEPFSFNSQGLSTYSLHYDFDEEDDELNFLPINLYTLPPQTDYILRKITHAYINSDVKDISQDIDFPEIVGIIDTEYKWSPKPFKIGATMYGFSGHTDEIEQKAQQVFSKLISFAALHRLPKEIVIFMFAHLESCKKIDPLLANKLKKMIESFDWKSTAFPMGLSIRLKRAYLQSKRKRFSLMPRNSVITKSRDALKAAEAIEQASFTKAPIKLAQKEDIVAGIDEIARELGDKSEFSLRGDSLINDLLTFFPRKNRVLARLQRTTLKQTKRLQAVGRAGLISYGVLNFLWYTFAVIWRWNALSVAPDSILVQGKMEALRISLQKFR